jgi:hypothetical protein
MRFDRLWDFKPRNRAINAASDYHRVGSALDGDFLENGLFIEVLFGQAKTE